MLFNIRLKDSSEYAYLSSVIKTKEKQLLSEGDFIEMLDQDISKFFSILVEKGYHLHDEKENITFEKLYEWEIWHLYHLLEELLSISNLAYLRPLFYLQNECVNLKLIGKKILFPAKKDKIELEDLNELSLEQFAIHNKNEIYSFYTEIFQSPDFFEKVKSDFLFKDLAENLLLIGKENLSGSKLDLLIDLLYFDKIKEIIKKSSSEFLLLFYDTHAGLINLKNVLRLYFEKKNFYDFEPFYIESTLLKKQDCYHLFETKFEKINSILVDNPLSSKILEIVSTVLKDKNLSILERWIDDILTEFIKENLKSAFFNFENLFAYKWAKEIELKNIKIIYVSKKNNIPKENIEKLIRKSYV